MRRLDLIWGRRIILVIPCLCLSLGVSSCLVRRHVVATPVAQNKRPLRNATKAELIQGIHDASDPIHSFTAKVELAASVGNIFGGEVSDYATIDGYILLDRPDTIRILGQDPVLHTTVFDMVSAGEDFRLSIPPKSRFIEGTNSAPAASQNKLENLRPTAFLNALMIAPPDPADLTVVEEDVDENNALYILLIVRREQAGLRLARSVYFDHRTLQIARQKTFDQSGGVLSDTKYANWKAFGRTVFPSSLELRRPQDGYALALTIDEMKVNMGDLTPEKFVLEPPAGTKVEQLK